MAEEEKIYVRYIDNESQIENFKSFKSYEPYSKIKNFIEANLISFMDEEIDKRLEKAEKGDQESQEWLLYEYMKKFPDIAFSYNDVGIRENKETGKMEISLISVGVNTETRGSSEVYVEGGIKVSFMGENRGLNFYEDGDIIIPERIVKIEKRDKDKWKNDGSDKK